MVEGGPEYERKRPRHHPARRLSVLGADSRPGHAVGRRSAYSGMRAHSAVQSALAARALSGLVVGTRMGGDAVRPGFVGADGTFVLNWPGGEVRQGRRLSPARVPREASLRTACQRAFKIRAASSMPSCMPRPGLPRSLQRLLHRDLSSLAIAFGARLHGSLSSMPRRVTSSRGRNSAARCNIVSLMKGAESWRQLSMRTSW